MDERAVMDEVLAETAIGGLVIQHRMCTMAHQSGLQPHNLVGVFVVRTNNDVVLINQLEMKQLMDWCMLRMEVGVIEAIARCHREWHRTRQQ